MNDGYRPSIPELSDQRMRRRRDHLLLEIASPAPGRRLRRPVLAAVGVIPATAAAITILLSAGPAANTAFAGWNAAPTQASAAQSQTAEASCRGQITNAARAAGPSSQGKRVSSTDLSSLRVALTDTRGPYSLLLFTGATTIACVTGPDFQSIRGVEPHSATPVAAGAIAVDQVGFTWRDHKPFTLIVGHAGADVSAVSLALDDSTNVDTTVSNGYFAAWWPNQRGIQSALVTTPQGTATQTLDIPGPARTGSK